MIDNMNLRFVSVRYLTHGSQTQEVRTNQSIPTPMASVTALDQGVVRILILFKITRYIFPRSFLILKKGLMGKAGKGIHLESKTNEK